MEQRQDVPVDNNNTEMNFRPRSVPELANYVKAASLLVRDDLPISPYPVSAYHPAAIKYFTEKKVKIGG